MPPNEMRACGRLKCEMPIPRLLCATKEESMTLRSSATRAIALASGILAMLPSAFGIYDSSLAPRARKPDVLDCSSQPDTGETPKHLVQ